MRHLIPRCSGRLFRISSQPGKLPTEAIIEVVPPTAEARIDVLRELGYAFSDFGLWDGWLFLEESSAERIIRNYLIPWFVPKLTRVRTVAANGASGLEPILDDFSRLMLFTHLQPAYSGRMWVFLDGDEVGQVTAEKLRAKFKSVASDHIGVFSQPQFELYYPKIFHEECRRTLSIDDKQQKRTAKRELLNHVMAWLDQDVERGKLALAESAAPVIQILQAIDVKLCNLK